MVKDKKSSKVGFSRDLFSLLFKVVHLKMFAYQVGGITRLKITACAGMFIGGRVDHRRHDTPQNCYYIICCCECCKPLPVKEGDKGRLFSPGDFERHAGKNVHNSLGGCLSLHDKNASQLVSPELYFPSI